jgi:hypothetical protein
MIRAVHVVRVLNTSEHVVRVLSTAVCPVCIMGTCMVWLVQRKARIMYHPTSECML